MTGPPRGEGPIRVSLCCARWRTVKQHDDCPGRVMPGNLSVVPLVPCGCECHDSQQTDRDPLAHESTVRR